MGARRRTKQNGDWEKRSRSRRGIGRRWMEGEAGSRRKEKSDYGEVGAQRKTRYTENTALFGRQYDRQPGVDVFILAHVESNAYRIPVCCFRVLALSFPGLVLL